MIFFLFLRHTVKVVDIFFIDFFRSRPFSTDVDTVDMNQLETTAKDDDDDGAGLAETSDYYELKDQSRLSDVEVISDDDSSNDLHDFMFNQNSQMDDLDNLSDNAQEDYAVYPNSSSCNGGDDDLSTLTSGKKVDNFFESDDSDVHFFKSILPFLKQITNPTTKLKVRLEIQDIILSAISSSSEAEAKE
jgi:BESS motif